MSALAYSEQSFFHVPYSGLIQRIDSSAVAQLKASDSDSVVARSFNDQMGRINPADMPSYIEPAKAGGLIIRGTAMQAARIYDDVFGSSQPVVKAKAVAPMTIANVQAEKALTMSSLAKMFMGDFGTAAAGKAFGLASSFAAVANNTNMPSRAPVAPAPMAFAA